MTPVAARLARLVPADADRVFEACRPGDTLAAWLRRRNPAVTVVSGSFAAPPEAAPQDGGFDALLFHDGLLDPTPDHQPDPMAMVAAALPTLRPGGALLLVLRRDWCEKRKAAQGKRSLIAALETVLNDGPLRDSGLTVDCAAMVPDGGGAGPYLIVRAARRGSFRRLYLGALTLRPTGGCNDARIDLPNAMMETVPGIRTSSAVGHVNHVDPLTGERRIAILQRRINGPADVDQLKGLLRAGYLLVSEFDDHPNHWPAMETFRHLTFRGVHAVQTSTGFLAGELRRHNPEVAVFPNQIATLPAPRQPRPDGRILLFFGAFNRGEDWRPLIEPLNRVLAAHRGRVGVRVIHDRAFFDALETDDKGFAPTCGYDAYIRTLRQCDIGLLPLNDTLFNRSKSDLKFIECAAHGVAALASPVVYEDTLRDNDTGVLFRSPEEFGAGLNRLIEDEAWRTGIVGRAHGYVRDHRMLARHVRKRLDWYQSLLDRREELDARLYERAPELRP